MAANKKISFEKSMERLEEIVKLMEQGDASLDESLSLFEEGAGLIASCGAMLDNAQQRVVKLKKGEGGEPEELPFDVEE